jgi:hypothetical protein
VFGQSHSFSTLYRTETSPHHHQHNHHHYLHSIYCANQHAKVSSFPPNHWYHKSKLHTLIILSNFRAPIPTPKLGTACMCNHHLKIMILDGKK